MGRHSRRGPAPKAETAGTKDEPAAARDGRTGRPDGRDGRPDGRDGRGRPPGPGRGRSAEPGPQERALPAPGAPRHPDAWGTGETPGQGIPRPYDGGPPARGAPAQGSPVRGTPAQRPTRPPQSGTSGTPARGVPRLPDGTPAHGVPQVRGGHPEQREHGGGWGEFRGRAGAGQGVKPGADAPASHQGRQIRQDRQSRQGDQGDQEASGRTGGPLPRQRRGPRGGPRQDYLDAFTARGDAAEVREDAPETKEGDFTPRASPRAPDPYASVTDWTAEDDDAVRTERHTGDAPLTGVPVAPAKGAKGRTFTGIAAAAVTTVLAIVVAGQVTGGSTDDARAQRSAADQARDARDGGTGTGESEEAPAGEGAAAPLTYEQQMGTVYPLGAELKGSGEFDAIPGIAKAPGKGDKYTYRVDVEQGLGLDGELFAQAVQKTLNDERSWAHNGAKTFERIHSGHPDFVITLASPGTTADWCAKSGLDTTVDNVSCDSAATERVMINAYRWAQGAKTYGDARIHAYREMLINHEVGHRLGHNHVTCDKDGDLAPVMQQQTKFLEYDGIRCRPNAWAYPAG
ncbi:DUF3152 domain-containing protein [Streptomyces ziwulingensis]|uniref:DUF3152 domain-containing protein n=1 Tax=Streptomyces ziwulingensis TaxID=1045501 RepID=A0ABP9CUI9_9ACTN